MEIAAQMAALEEEVKVLKGEIKSILEEIRSAVLAQDNPFDPEGGLRVFRPIERSGAGDESPSQPDEGALGPTTPPVTDDPAEDALPGVMPAEPPGAPPGDWGGPQTPPLPPMAGAAPEPASPPPMAAAGPQAAPPPATPAGNPEPAQPAVEAATVCPWSVSTIASLVAWVDETSRLGSTHLHIILDLARFAGLLPQEAEEALLKVIKLATSRKDSATVSVNDTLVALRQLEAIFEGTESDDLSVMRRRRNAGRNR